MKLLTARDPWPQNAVHRLTELLHPTKGPAPLRISVGTGVAGLGAMPANGTAVPQHMYFFNWTGHGLTRLQNVI